MGNNKLQQTLNWAHAQASYFAGTGEITEGQTKLTLFAPIWDPTNNDNEGSIFTLVNQSGNQVVMSGDAAFKTEAQVMQSVQWKADIVKCGHHGSRKSTSDEWLDMLKPSIGVISCGKDNSYGHPSKKLLNRLEGHKVKAVRTDEEGNLIYQIIAGKYVRGQASDR